MPEYVEERPFSTPVACATDLVRCMHADVQTSLRAIAIAMATNSMPWACAAAIVMPTRMRMAFATTWTPALENSMPVASATAQEKSTSVDVQTFLKETATAMATSSTPWMCVVATALRMPMPMAFVTTLTIVSAHLMPAASATAQAPSTNVDVLTLPRATATVKAINSMPWACAVVTARQTRMPMAFVTTWTTALGNTTSAGFAMGQAQCMPAAVQAFQKGIAIATATKKMRWAFAVAIVLPTKMRMASVTT